MQIIRFYVNIELFALLDSRSMETNKFFLVQWKLLSFWTQILVQCMQ